MSAARPSSRAAAAAALVLALALASSCGRASGSGTPLPELRVVFMELADPPPDLGLVEGELNRRYAARIGAAIRLEPMRRPLWRERLETLLAGDRPPDLIMVSGSMLTTLAARGALLALDASPLTAEPLAGAIEAVGPVYLRVGRHGGGLYAIPTIRDMASSHGLVMRADLAEELGIDPAAIRTEADLEAALAIVRRERPGLLPLVLETSSTLVRTFLPPLDSLGDDMGVLVLDGRDGARPLVDLFAMPEYERLVRLARSWNQKGYLPRDGATFAETPEDLLKAGAAFAALYHDKPGLVEQLSRITGRRLAGASLSGAVSTSDTVNNVMWAIPRAAALPEAAARLLGLMYTDPGLVNLLDWGIEGRHYVKVDDSTIAYPEGVDAASHRYAPNHGWEFGDQFLSYAFAGDAPGIWALTKAFNEGAARSPALGFTFSADESRIQYAAVAAVTERYRAALETGTIDPDPYLSVFRAELAAAGLGAVMAEKEASLGAWLASSLPMSSNR